MTNTTNSPINVTYTVTPTYGTSGCDGNPFTVTVTVNPKPVITNQSQTICSGATFTVTPSNGGGNIVPSGTTYSWSAPSGSGFSGGTAASGSSISGTLTNTTKSPVTATYTVTPTSGTGSCSGSSFTVTVTVNPTVKAGTISATASTICIGANSTYSTNGTTGGTWSSDNTGVATVNSTTGLVTGVSAGTTNIKYTLNSGCGAPVSSSAPVTVNPNVTSGTISGTSSPICIGANTTFSSNGTAGGTWSSSNTAIATVNATTGVITGVSAGTTNIFYTVTGCNAPAAAVKAITVSPNATAGTLSIVSGSATLCIGGTVSYSSNGDAGGTWSSSKPSVATVDPSTGMVTAVAQGTANIIYTVSSGCNSPVSASATVTVNRNANAGSITGANTICVGAQVSYSSSGDAGTWSSDNTGVATVNASTGIVKGIGGGTANITYTVTSGCNAPVSVSQPITVSSPGGVADPGTISGPVSVCASTSGNVYSIDPSQNPNATSFVWTVPAGWSIAGASNGSSITVTSGSAAGGNITVKAGNTCGFSGASTLYVGLHNYWTGAVSTDWNTAANWSDNQVPSNACNDVYIPNTSNKPVLSNSPVATITNLHILSNAKLTINGTGLLQIAGAISNAGTFDASGGAIEFNGTSPQTIAANTFLNNAVHDLIISNASATGVTLGGALDVYGSVTYGKNNALLNTGGYLTLKSTSTETASIGDMTNHKINGEVTVERYIGTGTLHAKSWQLLAVPTAGSNPGVNGQSIKDSWQEGASVTNINSTPGSAGNPHPGYGTMMTSDVSDAVSKGLRRVYCARPVN